MLDSKDLEELVNALLSKGVTRDTSLRIVKECSNPEILSDALINYRKYKERIMQNTGFDSNVILSALNCYGPGTALALFSEYDPKNAMTTQHFFLSIIRAEGNLDISFLDRPFESCAS